MNNQRGNDLCTLLKGTGKMAKNTLRKKNRGMGRPFTDVGDSQTGQPNRPVVNILSDRLASEAGDGTWLKGRFPVVRKGWLGLGL